MANKNEFKTINLPMNGRLRTSLDGTMLAEGDFQTLKNMRYGEVSVKSVSGMTKINTSVMNATYLKARAGHHFRKSQPSESHILVQAWNTGLTTAQILDNITAIPNQGSFAGSALWADSANASVGKFSDAPDGCVAYANGKDSCIWGGDEYRCAGFLVGDIDDNSPMYNYTTKINNTLSDANNVATMSTISGTLDSYTKALFHFDTNLEDATTNNHDATAAGSAAVSATQYKFGTKSCVFDGAGDYLTITDHADFDLSGGIWTVDFWIYASNITTNQSIYYQSTDANNYFEINIWQGGIYLKYVTASVTKVSKLSTSGLSINTWHHCEISENGDDYYLFIDGELVGHVTDTDRPINLTGNVQIGSGLAADYTGYIDELRISNGICRHTGAFTPETTAYEANVCHAYIAATRPIRGVKFYVGTANTNACVVTPYFWGSGTWHNITPITDGTSVGGKSLAQTGSITFPAGTEAGVKPRMVDNIYAYWYKFSFEAISALTTVYYCTLNALFQNIIDLWDGIFRPIASFLKYTGTKYKDETTNVLKEDYYHILDDPADNLTYSKCNLSTSGYLLCGFTERMTGIDFKIVTDKENAVACMMTVYYWNGSAWTEVTALNDGTRDGNASFTKSGTISWEAPSESAEFQTSIRSSSRMYWYYKIAFSETLTTATFVDQVQGVPAQKAIHAYSFPILWQNRLWLIDEASGKRNSAICTAVDTVGVFNGEDAINPESPLTFGNEDALVAGGGLFGRDGGNVYDILALCKKSEVWLTEGTTIEEFIKNRRKLSGNYGCIAPHSFVSCDLGYEIAPGVSKHVLIWLSQGAIILFDGNALQDISIDISDLFDPVKSTYLGSTNLPNAVSFYDSSKYEYHFLCNNQEWVYDLRKKKWFQIDRGSGKYIQIGFTARDTNGIAYTFGTIDTGYMERLEYGTTFDGTNITSQWRNGDISFGDWQWQTAVRNLKHIAVSKSTTTQSVVISHYGDTNNTASSSTMSCPLNSSTHRTVRKVDSLKDWGNFLFHSFAASVTISNENIGYEPIGLVVRYEQVREELI